MKKYHLITKAINAAGYDALCATLELELLPDGQILRFYDVPEDIWYALKGESMAESYFNRHIFGRFESELLEA